MNIITSTSNLSPRDIYFLTQCPSTMKMRDAKGTTLEIKNCCIYEDVNNSGEPQKIVAIRTPEKETYATNSPTFIRDFEKIVETFGIDGIPALDIVAGTSKQGREFITCALSDDE